VIGGIFVDGASMVYALANHSLPGVKERINYDALLKLLSERLGSKEDQVDFRFKHYYGSHRNGTDLSRHGGFYDALKGSGWVIYQTQAKQYSDGTFKEKQVDISIALDAYHLALLRQIQVLVVMTHDSDFAALLKRVPPGIRKVVIGWSDAMARELDQVAEGIFLDDIWKKVRLKGDFR